MTPELTRKRKYIAEVTIVDKVVDAASGTFGVCLELPNPGNHIPLTYPTVAALRPTFPRARIGSCRSNSHVYRPRRQGQM